jgi:hypothetical protein
MAPGYRAVGRLAQSPANAGFFLTSDKAGAFLLCSTVERRQPARPPLIAFSAESICGDGGLGGFFAAGSARLFGQTSH